MKKLDYAFLDELGLADLDKAAKDSLLTHLYDQLELNVGTVIAADLSDTQLKEFEQLVDQNQQAEALNWLQANYPGYKQVVDDQLEKLKIEVKQNAGKILEQSADRPD